MRTRNQPRVRASIVAVSSWFALALGVGCGSSEDQGPPSVCQDPGTEVTYHGSLRAVIETSCVTCHSDEGIAPFSLDRWESVRNFAEHVIEAIDEGEMPPAQADPACREMDGSRYLSPEQRALFHAWRDGGYLEGEECAYAPPEQPPAPSASDRGEPSLVLTTPEPVQLSDELYDDYHMVPIDHVFEEEVLVLATEFVSEHPSMVHHATVFVLDPDSPQIDPDQIAMGVVPMIGGQVPGTSVFAPPEGAAMRIPAGHQIWLDLHYHVHEHHHGELPTDRPQVKLWTLPSGETPALISESVVKTSYDFVIPAGEPDHVVQEVFDLPSAPSRVWGFLPHMHTRGAALRGEIIRGDGSRDCAISVINFDFRWQLLHRLPGDALLEIGPDDKLELSCHYDNSAENQPVVDGVRLPPEDVHEGPGSLDEMCQLQLFRLIPYAAE